MMVVLPLRFVRICGSMIATVFMESFSLSDVVQSLTSRVENSRLMWVACELIFTSCGLKAMLTLTHMIPSECLFEKFTSVVTSPHVRSAIREVGLVVKLPGSRNGLRKRRGDLGR